MAVLTQLLRLVTEFDGKGVDSATKGLDSLESRTGGFGSKLGALGGIAATAFAAVGAAGVAGLGASVKVAADFESSLNGVQAATGATADEMKALRAEALSVGKDTSKSASDSVEAFGELAKAGVSVKDIVGGVGRTTVQLAEATGQSVGSMANLLSNTLNTFGLGADQAAKVADTLAKAANASAIDVGDMAQSLQAVGPVAKQAGLSANDFATAIGLMGNQGLKGADAGTSLKTMLLSLTAPTDKAKKLMEDLGVSVFDAQGKTRNFRDILGDLQKAFSTLSDEEKARVGKDIFGTDAIRAANILLGEGVEGWDKFNAAMGQAPSVAEQSKIRLQGLGGQMEQFKGSLETIAIQVGTALLPALTKLAELGVKGLNWLLEQDWSGVTDAFNTIAGAAGDLASALVKAFQTGDFGPFFDKLSELGGRLTEQLGEWGKALVDWIGPQIGPMIEQLAQLSEQLVTWVKEEGLPALGAAVKDWGGALIEWVSPQIPPLLEALGGLLGEMLGWVAGTALPEIAGGLADWGKALIEWVGPRIGPMLEALGGLLAELGGWLLGTALPEIVANLAEWGGAFIAWVGPKIPELLAELGGLLTALGGWLLGTALPQIVSHLAQWATAFLGWVATDVLPQLPDKLGAILSTVGGWITGSALPWAARELAALGQAMIDGVVAGIRAAAGAIGDALTAAARGALERAKSALGIGSPSRATNEQVGVPMAQGIVAGLESQSSVVQQAAVAVAEGAVSAAAGVVAGSGGGAGGASGAGGNAITMQGIGLSPGQGGVPPLPPAPGPITTQTEANLGGLLGLIKSTLTEAGFTVISFIASAALSAATGGRTGRQILDDLGAMSDEARKNWTDATNRVTKAIEASRNEQSATFGLSPEQVMAWLQEQDTATAAAAAAAKAQQEAAKEQAAAARTQTGAADGQKAGAETIKTGGETIAAAAPEFNSVADKMSMVADKSQAAADTSADAAAGARSVSDTMRLAGTDIAAGGADIAAGAGDVAAGGADIVTAAGVITDVGDQIATGGSDIAAGADGFGGSVDNFGNIVNNMGDIVSSRADASDAELAQRRSDWERQNPGKVAPFAEGGLLTRPTLLMDAMTRRVYGTAVEGGAPEWIVPLPKMAALTRGLSGGDGAGLVDRSTNVIVMPPSRQEMERFERERSDRFALRQKSRGRL